MKQGVCMFMCLCMSVCTEREVSERFGRWHFTIKLARMVKGESRDEDKNEVCEWEY